MKLTQLLEGHFQNKILNEQKGDLPKYSPQDLPIKPRDNSKWKVLNDPNRYRREFELKGFRRFSNFVQDVLELQDETKHHGKILLVYPKVIIEVNTHVLNDVTDVDRDWCRKVDQIYGGYNE